MKGIPVLIILTVMLLISGCKGKNESLDPAAGDTLQVRDTSMQGQKLMFKDCDAMVVGEGVRLRTAPDLKADVVEKLHTGSLLRIVGPGDKKVSLSSYNACDPDGYLWYEVITASGERGWLYGEFIYQLLIPGKNVSPAEFDDPDLKMLSRVYMFNDKWYKLGYATADRTQIYRQQGVPADTVCVEYTLPFFYNEQEAVAFPWQFVHNRRNRIDMFDLTKDRGFYQMVLDGLYSDFTDAFRMLDHELQVTMARDYDDGDEPFRYTLRIRFANGAFTATPADPGKEYLP